MLSLGFQNGKGFTVTKNYFRKLTLALKKTVDLHKYGTEGVAALAAATPEDTGETARSWRYRIKYTANGLKIEWYNTNKVGDGIPVAILLQYGHATKNGCWIEGRDYINPVTQPIFDRMAKEVWAEVTNI